MEICCEKPDIDSALEKGRGFYLGLKLQPNELAQVRSFVTEHWLDRIRQQCPLHWKDFERVGIERYHELCHVLDHGVVWTKSVRMFPRLIVEKIRSMSLIASLEDVYGPIEIVDEEHLGYEEIDWRLVRPGEPSDVGPLHADSWFCELGHGVTPPKGTKAIKVWVALSCEPGRNGLKVVPDSHKKTWRYHGEFRHGFVKPQIDEDEAELSPILLPMMPGDAVVFHDKLLHAGALNQGFYTRVSMEFMVFVKMIR